MKTASYILSPGKDHEVCPELATVKTKIVHVGKLQKRWPLKATTYPTTETEVSVRLLTFGGLEVPSKPPGQCRVWHEHTQEPMAKGLAIKEENNSMENIHCSADYK